MAAVRSTPTERVEVQQGDKLGCTAGGAEVMEGPSTLVALDQFQFGWQLLSL